MCDNWSSCVDQLSTEQFIFFKSMSFCAQKLGSFLMHSQIFITDDKPPVHVDLSAMLWASMSSWLMSFCISITHPNMETRISLTSKSIPAGTKKSHSEGFLLATHKHTNIPTMMEPFTPPAAWFCQSSIPHPWEPLLKVQFPAVTMWIDRAVTYTAESACWP
jgi:hypothetical protein